MKKKHRIVIPVLEKDGGFGQLSLTRKEYALRKKQERDYIKKRETKHPKLYDMSNVGIQNDQLNIERIKYVLNYDKGYEEAVLMAYIAYRSNDVETFFDNCRKTPKLNELLNKVDKEKEMTQDGARMYKYTIQKDGEELTPTDEIVIRAFINDDGWFILDGCPVNKGIPAMMLLKILPGGMAMCYPEAFKDIGIICTQNGNKTVSLKRKS